MRTLSVLLLMVLASAGSAATIFRQHVVRDPGMNGQAAVTVLVPEGWAVEGGITRPGSHLFMVPVLMDMKVRAPDGRQVRFYPSLQLEYSTQQPREPMSATPSGRFYYPLPPTVGAWIADLVRRFPAPGIEQFRVVGERGDPAATAALRQQNGMMFQMVQQGRAYEMRGGPRKDFDTQATLVTLRYKEHGRDVEETVLVAWQAFTTSWNGAPFAGQWTVSSMVSLRGAPGSRYVDDPILQAVLRSPQPDPTWDRRMREYWAEIMRIQAKGAAERQEQSYLAHQKRMQTLGEVSDIIHQGWRTTTTADSSGQSRIVDSIHEVTPYRTPAGETVRLPSFYDQVYTDGQGRFLLGNDSLYDPNTDRAVNQSTWQRVQPAN